MRPNRRTAVQVINTVALVLAILAMPVGIAFAKGHGGGHSGGHGYGPYVMVYLPGVGWVLVPLRAIRGIGSMGMGAGLGVGGLGMF
jgi:hypothetical protein